jgi:hypothetical protein
MADNDAAFLWETEALRSSASQASPESVEANGRIAETDWVTLRRANEATGIPLKTLRKWARHEHVASYLEDSSAGQLRMVSLSDVRDRARQMGRQDDPAQQSSKAKPIQKSSPSVEPTLQESRESEQPPGTMLVPIDAWDKMLLQLGNLHQAGQQLAEARERAGKAETESKFLKERIAEMRTQLAEARSQPLAPSKSLNEEPEREPEPAPFTDETIEDDDEILVEDLAPVFEPNDEGQSVATYSLEMMKHIYSTWRGRPRR